MEPEKPKFPLSHIMKGKFVLSEAEAVANLLVSLLQSACDKVDDRSACIVAGSIRRRKPYVGDIELLAIPKYDGGIDQLDKKIHILMGQGILSLRLNKLGRTIYGPKNKLLRHVESGIGVDIFSTDEQCWAVSLVVRTGGKETNKIIASRALERGMRFHAYGRGFTQADGSEIICRSEAAVFWAVGLKYQNPWERR